VEVSVTVQPEMDGTVKVQMELISLARWPVTTV
jgi:hypothetical protein